MRASPQVSVIVPCYNVARTLGRAVESIIRQSFVDWECILVDDGSCDTTGLIATNLAARDPRLRVLGRNVNRGMAYSLNEAVAGSSAELIARMDADDEALPDRLQIQVDFMREHPRVDVCGGAAWYVTASGAEALVTMPLEHEELVEGILWRCPLIHPTVVFRRAFIERAGGYAGRWPLEDYDLWLRTYKWAEFANVPQALIRYRYRAKPSLRTAFAAAFLVWRHARKDGAHVGLRLFGRAVAGQAALRLVPERWRVWRWQRRAGGAKLR